MFVRTAARSTSQQETNWPAMIVGSLLMLHFVLVCGIKSAQGFQADIFWMSHVALALAGAGFLLHSRVLIGAALTSVAFSHALWLFDFCAAQVTGSHPLWITHYLAGADAPTWIATAHHFYLLPLLLLTIRRFSVYQFDSFVLATVLTIAATLISRALLPEHRNVNWAFAIMPGGEWELLQRVNALSAAPFLIALLAWQTLIMLLPAALLLRWATTRFAVQYRTANLGVAPASLQKPGRKKRAA